MTFYGPWIQAPDFIAYNEPAFSDVADKGFAERVIENPVAWIIPTGGDITSVQQAANTGGALVASHPDVGAPQPSGPMEFSIAYTTETDGITIINWVTTLRARMEHPAGVVSPYTEGAHMWAPILLGALPEGAIGWQWQSDLTENTAQQSQVVSATLYPVVSGKGLDTSSGDGRLSGAWATQWLAVGGEYDSETAVIVNPAVYYDTVTTWTGPLGGSPLVQIGGPNAEDYTGTPIEVAPIDLTPHLDYRGRVVITAQMEFDEVGTAGPADHTEDAGIGYGYLPSYPEGAVEWTFTPPVFRWIFDGFQSGKPTRLYPTDHRLRPTPRIFPPSKSRHGGHKPTGYR